MDQVFTEMEGDQAALAPYYAGDIAVMMTNNDNLDYVLPEEGSNLFIDSMCIPKTTKHKELAEKFINYMLEAELRQTQNTWAIPHQTRRRMTCLTMTLKTTSLFTRLTII